MTIIARGLVVALVLGCAVGAASAAPIDEAKKAFAEGKAAFERGDYESALAAYQRANMILPAPNLYYNIGATYERLGRFQEAALAFDKYFEMAGAPTTDEERDFQEKLKARSEADRKKPNLPPKPATQQPLPPPVVQPPPQPNSPYYTPYYYNQPPQQQPKEVRLKEAHARRTRAIVLMGIGVPMTVVGIILCAWAAAPDVHLTFGEEVGYEFLGITLGIVGVTLWAPGAASFVKSSNDMKRIQAEREPAPPPPVAGAMPPTARGF